MTILNPQCRICYKVLRPTENKEPYSYGWAHSDCVKTKKDNDKKDNK